jgi:hypothetical protein
VRRLLFDLDPQAAEHGLKDQLLRPDRARQFVDERQVDSGGFLKALKARNQFIVLHRFPPRWANGDYDILVQQYGSRQTGTFGASVGSFIACLAFCANLAP